MKRPIAACIAAIVFALVLLSQTTSLTALVSPVPTLVVVSPLHAPTAHYDANYTANPRKITAHPVPYVNQAGETVVQESIYQELGREAIVVDVKAPPAHSTASALTPLAFQSPIGFPYPNNVYLPMLTMAVKHDPIPGKVLAIAYEGETAWNDPSWLAQQQINHIASGTTFHKIGSPAIQYTLADGAVHYVYTYPPTSTTYSGWIDLNAVYQQFNICNRVASEGINEVWIYVDGKQGGNFYSGNEWLENGPIWSYTWGLPIDPPNCGRQIFTMLYNFDVPDNGELHSWLHSAEWSFANYILNGTAACDVTKPGAYGNLNDYTDPNCSTIGSSSVSGFEVLADDTNNYTSVCGDVHNPPNRLASEAHAGPTEYIYNSPIERPSRCTDWQWNILTNTVPVSSGTWGNTEIGYYTWWMQNVPGKDNNLHGRDGSLRYDWWYTRLP